MVLRVILLLVMAVVQFLLVSIVSVLVHILVVLAPFVIMGYSVPVQLILPVQGYLERVLVHHSILVRVVFHLFVVLFKPVCVLDKILLVSTLPIHAIQKAETLQLV